MSMRRIAGVGAAALTVAAVAAGWLLLGPAQVGGATSYAVVVGSSMEPTLERGDLALVRRSGTYRAGDVVLYDSRELGSKVLHRIVRVEGGRYVLKGDNNDFLDPERPTGDQIVGKLWVDVPAVGRLTGWLREPRHAALLVGLVALLALGAGAGVGAAAGRPSAPVPARPSRRRSTDEQRLLLGAGAVVAALVALGAAAFTRPTVTEQTVEAAYSHQGRFAYEARVPRSPVYPDGRVTTGEPVFLRLVPRLRVSFDYGLETDAAARTRGTVALDARVSDGRGWQRVLPLTRERPFVGGAASVDGVLDLQWIERLVGQVGELTGSAQSAFTVSVLPRVALEGRIGADSVETSFAPALTFDLGDLRLQPNLDGEGVGPLAPRESGTGTVVVPAQISLGALSLDVATARRAALLGLALVLLASGVALAARRRDDDPADELYAHLIVPVGAGVVDGRRVTEVEDLDALARLAEHHGRLILRAGEGADRVYVVEEGGNAFVHRPQPPPPTLYAEGALIPGAGGARYGEQRARRWGDRAAG